jgi:hypothetical protein
MKMNGIKINVIAKFTMEEHALSASYGGRQ